MAKFSRTWWGQRFIAALEEFTDPGRLGRGRSYASNGRILKYTIMDGKVTATVRGSINPYYGIYKEPRYTTTIAIAPIRPVEWTKAIAIAPTASYYTRPTRDAPEAAGSYREFWAGARRLPPPSDLPPPSVPALLIKKQGDYPPFWRKDGSFIAAMEELYAHVRTKNSQMK